MKKPIPEKLVAKTKKFLGVEGTAFFKKVKQEHGTVFACWNEGGIPHAVHFREGMQIRNFMRGTGLCDGWEDHDFDDNWVELVEQAIEEGVIKNYHERAKLAIESMEGLLSCSHLGSEEARKIIEYWKQRTREPFNKEAYYKAVEASIAHLRRKPKPWDSVNVNQSQ
jgi:hypothetical protein